MSGLVKELNYSQIKNTAVPSRPVINRYRANNSSHTANQWIEIEIPSTQNLHLFPHDSFLEFEVSIVNETVNVMRFDESAYSLFRTMEVIVGGQVMERQNFTNKLWSVLGGLTFSSDQRGYKSVSLAEDHEDLYGTGKQIPASVTTTFGICFELPSALLGSLSTKALPLSQLYNSSIVLRLEIDSLNNWVVNDTATTTTIGAASSISNVYFNCKCSMLPSDVESALISSVGGTILLPATAYAGEYKQVSSTTTAFNDKFSFQYDSLNAILFWFIPSGAQNDIAYRSNTGRCNRNMHQFSLDINGQQYPESGPIGHSTSPSLAQARFVSELRRSFDHLGTNMSLGVITSENYLADDGNIAKVAHSTLKKNVYGIDLNRFNASQETMFAGINTRGQQVSLNCKFSAAAAASTDHYLYAVAMYDVLYTIEGGLMTARY